MYGLGAIAWKYLLVRGSKSVICIGLCRKRWLSQLSGYRFEPLAGDDLHLLTAGSNNSPLHSHSYY